MNVWLIEPYFTGSHEAWARGYREHSRHAVRLLTLPGHFWKWRMQGGALTLARQAQALGETPNLILATSMLNLPVFLAFAGRRFAHVPLVFYFHENQLTYPLRPGEKQDLGYGFINLVSALRADRVCFNSAYHRDSFLDELPRLLKHYPDYTELWTAEALMARSQVLPLGLDLARLDRFQPIEPRRGRPLILWNHRWEYDKDPETFFRALYTLADEGLDFGVLLLGENLRQEPREFLEARQRLGNRIVHYGYAPDLATYGRLLWQADIVVSTAIHDFFGAAVVEACYCGCFPILPQRLSYPELIPGEWHEVCLYNGWRGLLARLRQALTGRPEGAAESLRQQMAGYDWQKMAPLYDDLLDQVAAAPLSDGPMALADVPVD